MAQKTKIKRSWKFYIIGCLIVFIPGTFFYFSSLRKVYHEYPIARTRLSGSARTLEKTGNVKGYDRINLVSGSVIIPAWFSIHKILADQKLTIPSADCDRFSSILLENKHFKRTVISIESRPRHYTAVNMKGFHLWQCDRYGDMEKTLKSKYRISSVMKRGEILQNYKKAEICPLNTGDFKGFAIHGAMDTSGDIIDKSSTQYLYTFYLFNSTNQFTFDFFVINNSLSRKNVETIVSSFRAARY